jgi:hypothetical protein
LALKHGFLEVLLFAPVQVTVAVSVTAAVCGTASGTFAVAAENTVFLL